MAAVNTPDHNESPAGAAGESTASESTAGKSAATRAALAACLERQRTAYLADPYPSYQQRIADLKTLQRMLQENRDALVAAVSADYGSRSEHETLFTEYLMAVDSIKDTLKKLKRWMKPQKRHVDLVMFPGGKNRVIPQPLGVVGVIVPWNFPINLSFGPLLSAFAAGNRAMVKMSENSRQLTQLLISLSERYFPKEKLAFFEETGGVGIEFSKLPFDLLFFTGSSQTGSAVMAAAAQNLTPVVLELGGKAPAVIDANYPHDLAAQRIMFVKQLNAGQICTNVDYVFVHESKKAEFIDFALQWVRQHVPDIQSKDFTSIIDDRSFARLQATLEDARSKGATVLNLNGNISPDPTTRKFPLHIVTDTTPEMTIRQRETFGPILMLMTYTKQDEVAAYINSKPRPLALYPFSYNRDFVDYFIRHVMSGGVTVNDALLHVGQHDLPFGGVGASGMGHYHGQEGFITMSKLRPVFYQPKFSALKFLQPPYTGLTGKLYRFLVKLKG